MRINTIVCVFFVSLLTGSCATNYTSYYPSYEVTMAKYAPPGEQPSERLTDSSMYPDSEECDCPRVWYTDHWVYYYHGSWIFWHHGYWFYYPYFDWYYFGYGPIFYQGPGRVIFSTSPSKAETTKSIEDQRQPPQRITDTYEPGPGEIRNTPSRDSTPSSPPPRQSTPNRSSPSNSRNKPN